MNIIVDSSGILRFGEKQFKCALGRSGISIDKKEGDGATPAGCFQIRKIFYRADRIPEPKAPFDVIELKPKDGWCDDPVNSNYNRYITLPYPANTEKLWREDGIYDVIVVLGYNDDPIIPGKGSAIFMHVARENYSPTEGCIALSQKDILELLSLIGADTSVCVEVKVGNVSN